MPRPRPDPESIPRVTWDQFVHKMTGRRSPTRWRQGEHLSGIGPTGTGKTTAILELLAARSASAPKWHTCVLATKPADDTLGRLLGKGDFTRVQQWPPHNFDRSVVLWPQWRDIRDFPRQRAVFSDAFQGMFGVGGWCIFADELSYLSRELKLDAWLRSFWQQGRSLNLTLVGATQRPAWVPLDLYSAPTHLMFWRTNDDQDLRRIGGIGGMASNLIRETVATLDHRSNELLYINSRTGEMLRTAADLKVTA